MNSIGNPPDDIDVFVAEMEKELAILEKEIKQQSSKTSSALDHWYSPHYNHVRQLLEDRPHKQLEQMSGSKRVHIINTNARAFEVLPDTLLYVRNELFRTQTYVVSITQSLSLGEEQRRMFEAESEVLHESECQAQLLFSEEKGRLQHSLIPPKTFLITSPHFLLELLINPHWKQNYGVPAIIILTDLDSYPPRLFQVMVPVIRVLLWKHPQIQIIINSETLGSSSQIARLFFGDKTPVLQIQGVKMQGETSFLCYREYDMPFSHLIVYLKEQEEKTQSGLLNPMYFHKEICYISDQWVVDWLLASEYMSDAFVVIHENLSQEEIIKRLDTFRVDPLKPCLITTDIIEGDYYLPHIRGGFFYGLPADSRTFLRIRHHICRIPQLSGRFRLVLRETHPTEKVMTQQSQIPDLEYYISQEDHLPILIPYYTPESLQMWVALGVMAGFIDALTWIQAELEDCDETSLIPELLVARDNLIKSQILRKNIKGDLQSTKKMRSWLYRKFNYKKDSNCDMRKV